MQEISMAQQLERGFKTAKVMLIDDEATALQTFRNLETECYPACFPM